MNIDDIHPEDLEELINNGKISSLTETDKPNPAPAPVEAEKITPTESATGILTPTRDQGFDIADPVELLFLLDDDIKEGRVVLHDWQTTFMIDFAREHTKELPFQACVQAANGSGKDKFVVAACSVWICMRYLQARCVITNGSGVQLDNQTELYIRLLCNAVNSKIGAGIWKTNYRYYECLATGSPMVLFATDEPAKAEGYHPIVAGSKMAIFASEAKAIPDEIFTALERCSGFTHRIDVSTPGLPIGYFYDLCTTALDRKTIKDIKSVNSTQVIKYLVTAYDCSHIAQSEIDRIESKLPGGKHNPVFKSSILAEFTTTDEQTVIPYSFIWQAVNNAPKHIKEDFNSAGLDLSDGGAETALTIRNGNKHIITIPFRFQNTEDTVVYLDEKFREYELNNPKSFIYADASGMGKPIIDRLKRMGWVNMRYVINNAKANEWRVYANHGSEMWFNVRRLLEVHDLIIQNDKLLIKQLATRYYKITIKNTHQLLSKLEQRSRGYPSPDRADAFVLAFCSYKSNYKESAITDDTRPFKLQEETKPVSEFNLKEWSKRDSENPNETLHPSRNKDFTIYKRAIAEHNRMLKYETTKN